MAYTKNTWTDAISPLSAARMNNLETQYDEVIDYFIRAAAMGMFSGVNGDLTISSSQAATEQYYVKDNLTINAGVTLTLVTPITFFFIKDTLTLNGTIDASGLGTNGVNSYCSGGNGGNGGGVVFIIAKTILGSGSILANGVNGVSPASASVSGGSGLPNAEDSSFGGIVINGGRNLTAGAAGSGGTVDGAKTKNVAVFPGVLPLLAQDKGGAGGGCGGCDTSSTYTFINGGGGGAGCYGNGGNAQYVSAISSAGAGGGGGGGGGAIIILAHSAIPALTLQAKGGNGGNGFVGCGGGGGGGGIVNLVATASSATITISNGSGGAKGSDAAALPGLAGGAGYSRLITTAF